MLLTDEDLSLIQLFLKNTLQVIEFVKLTSFLAERLRDSHKIHPNQVCDCVDSLFSVNSVENLLHSLRYIKNTLEILLSSKEALKNIDCLWPLILRRKDLSLELDDIYEAAHRKHHRCHWLKHRKTRTCSRKRPTACKDHPFDGIVCCCLAKPSTNLMM